MLKLATGEANDTRFFKAHSSKNLHYALLLQSFLYSNFFCFFLFDYLVAHYSTYIIQPMPPKQTSLIPNLLLSHAPRNIRALGRGKTVSIRIWDSSIKVVMKRFGLCLYLYMYLYKYIPLAATITGAQVSRSRIATKFFFTFNLLDMR